MYKPTTQQLLNIKKKCDLHLNKIKTKNNKEIGLQVLNY
jgi:hypothetical protein